MDLLSLPRSVDDPNYFLIWRLDDFFLIVGGIGVGLAMDHPLIGGLVAMTIVYFFARYRDGRPDLYVFHALYWFGLTPDRGRSFRNAFVRRYTP